MQTMRHWLVWVAGILSAAALTPAAQAQIGGGTIFVPLPTFVSIQVQTSVMIPDSGSVDLGGYSRVSEGRSESGVPVLGRLPYAGRSFRNTGYGRTLIRRRVNVRVRIIDLRAEEYRQTGVRR